MSQNTGRIFGDTLVTAIVKRHSVFFNATGWFIANPKLFYVGPPELSHDEVQLAVEDSILRSFDDWVSRFG